MTQDAFIEKAAREGARYTAAAPSVQPRSGRVISGQAPLGSGGLVRPRSQTFFGGDGGA